MCAGPSGTALLFLISFQAVFWPSAFPVQVSPLVDIAWNRPDAASPLRSRSSLYRLMVPRVTRLICSVELVTVPETATSMMSSPSLIFPAPKTSPSFWKRDRARSFSWVSLSRKDQLPPTFAAAAAVWAGGSSVSAVEAVAVDALSAVLSADDVSSDEADVLDCCSLVASASALDD